jgi:hypothetical protein
MLCHLFRLLRTLNVNLSCPLLRVGKMVEEEKMCVVETKEKLELSEVDLVNEKIFILIGGSWWVAGVIKIITMEFPRALYRNKCFTQSYLEYQQTPKKSQA